MTPPPAGSNSKAVTDMQQQQAFVRRQPLAAQDKAVKLASQVMPSGTALASCRGQLMADHCCAPGSQVHLGLTAC